MSVKIKCDNCKHYNHGACQYAESCKFNANSNGAPFWELSDGIEADVLHDAEQQPKEAPDETMRHEPEAIAVNIFREMNKPKHDAVNSPAHYTSGGIECIDCIKAALGENFIGFLIGNVIKYCYRYRNKNGLEDLKKARWYIDKAIKELEV